MKKGLKIVGYVLLAVVLAVYVCVALANYSVVQSVIGAEVSKKLSAEWGGKVKIGSLHIHPFNHFIANEMLLVAPDGDTILDAETLRIQFKRFPLKGNKLELNRIYLKNAYYHLAVYSPDDTTAPQYLRDLGGEYPSLTNLHHIIARYIEWPLERKEMQFTVDINEVILNHVHYKMDLPDHRKEVYEYGVEIPHMEFYDICSKINKIHVVNDDVTCRLVRLSAEERSGFKANDIAGRVHVCRDSIVVTDFKAETDRSVIKADVTMEYGGWESMADYLHVVRHEVALKQGTSVAVSDIAYWAPVLWGIDMQLIPVGKVDGTVNRIHTDGMSLRMGHASEVALEGDINGLANIDSLSLDLSQLDIRFEQSDLTNICAMMPQFITPDVAKYLHDIEYIDLTAQAHGGLKSESTANINLVCGLGNLRADAKITPTRNGRRILLYADSDGMGLTPLGSDWLTHSGLTLHVDADLPNNLKKNIRAIDAEATADLDNCVVKGYNINPVYLHAYMKGGKVDFAASCTDSLFNVDMHGNAKLTDSVKGYYAYIDLLQLQADTFGLVDSKYGRISTHMEANFKGNNIDEMRGVLTAHNTRVGSMKLHELTLSLLPEDAKHKNLKLESEALTATVGGRFKYADLPLMLQHVCHTALPSDLQLVAKQDSTALAAIDGNTINFHMRIDDATVLNQALTNITLANGTRIDGTYNNYDLLRLVARSDAASIGSVTINNIGLYSHYDAGKYNIDIESSAIDVSNKKDLVNDIELHLSSNQQLADAQIKWGDSLQDSHGDLFLSMKQGNVQVIKPFFFIGESRWQLGIDSLHLATAPTTALEGHGISLDSDRQHIDARLKLLHQDNDYVELNLDNFNLNPLNELLLQESPINLGGAVNGRFTLFGMSSTPYFNANLTIDSCVLNRQELGELTVRSNWNAETNTLNLQVGGNTLHATGWIGLAGDKDIDFAVDFNRFELASVAPLMSTFSSRFEGRLEGTFDINGTLRNPVVTGEAYIDGGALKIDPTGVTYYFNDSIQFNNSQITMNDFHLLDPYGNVATMSGRIGYGNLDNISIDLNLNTDNITVLNQRNGETFYGTVLAQATGRVRGNLDQLNINVKARTNPGTTLTVPVTDRRQVQAQDYITFVGDEIEQDIVQQKKKESTMGFNIDMDLTITPDAQLNLPMDFSEVSVDVNGNGNGDLHMTLNESLEPQVIGNYEISSGTLKFGLVSIIEKTFSLEPGSSLNFQGSLPDARFDLQAVYAQRVNLSTLTGTLSAVDNSQKYIQVEDVIAINGTLNNPTIGFDIRLPNADASVEEEVFAYIDRNSERDMLNQTISLLLMGQFYNMSGNINDNSNLLGSGLSSGYSMVASTMGNMVSDMVQIVDVDFKYKAATEMTNEQVDVNISKDWGRWYLESTLGYGGDSRELEGDANGNAVIDALLGYRISDLVHIYAYNRTNNNDYTRIDLPYKQGAGLKLTKDFDNWGDLFVNKNKKKRK